MSDYFYGGSSYAVKASKPQMIKRANEIQQIIKISGELIELVAVNKYYRNTCICRYKGRLYKYLINGEQIKREFEFRGYGGDPWKEATDLVQLRELEEGQMELF